MNTSIFGGFGFVLGEYFQKFDLESIRISKYDYVPQSNKILYGISTVHNYHVFENPYKDIDTNLTTLITTLENCKKLYGNKFEFNFLSSWFVYGDVPLPATEKSECHPKGFYSITKKAAEDLLVSYCTTYDISYRILRLANVLGASDHKASAKKNALQWMIGKIMDNEEITLYYRGNFFRDFIDVRDCADAIKLVIDNGTLNSVYNISNGLAVYFGDLIKYIMEKTGSKSNIEHIDNVPFHKNVQVKSMYMSNSKLVKLGYAPNYTIYETLDDIIKAYAR